jgi:redox-sensing transcriptional repressor
MQTSKNCVIRLSYYKSALSRLKAMGFVKVFSDNIADAVGVTAAQVRKDFSLFDICGSRKGGYTVDDLINQLNGLLGKNTLQNVILIGSGNIGRALLNYKGFEKEGIKIVAAFDTNADKNSRIADIQVLPLESLEKFIRENKVRIGIIAIPDFAAQAVADKMIAAGIKGILNFAPIQLRGPEEVVINNVNLVLELENVIYFTSVGLRK